MTGYSTSSARFLKRKYSFEDGELFVRPDSKYVTKLLENLGLEKRTEKNTPAPGSVSEVDNTEELNEKEASIYRSCLVVLLYVGQDRPDVQFAARNLATAIKNPTKKRRKELDICALYLKKTSNSAVCYSCASAGISVLRSDKRDPHDEQEGPYTEQGENLLEVFSDADRAGDKYNRRSVSGSVIFLNGQFVYSYSRTQKTVAFSSEESEYYAVAGAVSEALGVREAVFLLAGKPTKLKAHTDSSAAGGIVNRRGVMGRVKHFMASGSQRSRNMCSCFNFAQSI